MMTDLLDSISSPEDLKGFSLEQLQSLALELRHRIIHTLSVNGGHLASNLGSVELSVGLHYVFHSPSDRIIFDVSHQTYTHKLLTGRNDARFDKIRKTAGLSGFAHPKESPHDHFYAGHAGTALSLGLGVALARDLDKGTEHVIPVIGDATLSCGLSLEALNNIPSHLRNFIIVLNDNEMSISGNVGGICGILHGLRKGQRATFFEQFGLDYVGIIDGHNIEKVIEALQSARNHHSPILIHFSTKKGNGVEVAEKDPIAYHGVKPFDPSTYKFIPKPTSRPTFPKIFGRHILEMGRRDNSLVVVTPAMSLGSYLDPFMAEFPERSFDVGIAEGHAVTFAGGLARYHDRKVVCSIYATFLQRALDNLFQDVCLQDLPVVFAIDRAGLAAGDGATHHGIYEISFLKSMPNMVICQPRNGQLLKELMESAFLWRRPTAIRYPNMETEEGNQPLCYRPLGKGEILLEGEDILILALGYSCSLAQELCEQLKQVDVAATLVDPIFVKPLDTNLLGKLLLSHKRVVTIEEHSLKGGLGNEVNQFILSHEFDVQVLNFGIPERFMDHGSYSDLLHDIGMSPSAMLGRILTHFSLGTKVGVS
ncbi:MAG: 1-deoxy-D-xylulose-5-phosphate synthase [Chlamydiales bacterium]